MFNEVLCRSEKDYILRSGVKLVDTTFIDPALRPYERDGEVLKRKFGTFKSASGTCVFRITSSGSSDSGSFVLLMNWKSSLMYAISFLQKHDVLLPLNSTAVEDGNQR